MLVLCSTLEAEEMCQMHFLLGLVESLHEKTMVQSHQQQKGQEHCCCIHFEGEKSSLKQHWPNLLDRFANLLRYFH